MGLTPSMAEEIAAENGVSSAELAEFAEFMSVDLVKVRGSDFVWAGGSDFVWAGASDLYGRVAVISMARHSLLSRWISSRNPTCSGSWRKR